MENQEIATKIKQKIEELNLLIEEANKVGLKVTIEQRFHPLMNAKGALNAAVNVNISSTTNY